MGLLNAQLLNSQPAKPDSLQAKSPQPSSQIAGIAYGSYARLILSTVLEELEEPQPLTESPCLTLQFQFATPTSIMPTSTDPVSLRLEDRPELLWRAVDLARELVADLKPLGTVNSNISYQ